MPEKLSQSEFMARLPSFSDRWAEISFCAENSVRDSVAVVNGALPQLLRNAAVEAGILIQTASDCKPFLDREQVPDGVDGADLDPSIPDAARARSVFLVELPDGRPFQVSRSQLRAGNALLLEIAAQPGLTAVLYGEIWELNSDEFIKRDHSSDSVSDPESSLDPSPVVLDLETVRIGGPPGIYRAIESLPVGSIVRIDAVDIMDIRIISAACKALESEDHNLIYRIGTSFFSVRCGLLELPRGCS